MSNNKDKNLIKLTQLNERFQRRKEDAIIKVSGVTPSRSPNNTRPNSPFIKLKVTMEKPPTVDMMRRTPKVESDNFLKPLVLMDYAI